ncbi:MAG: membrane protein insertase YidC [Ferruginibacter sp.]|nr:membrane protein insertase YidC [Ferruginibacter sp.]
MGFDRNTIIGFVLIGVLLVAMFVINSRSRLAYEAEQLRIKDSIENLKPKIAPELAAKDSVQAESLKVEAGVGAFQVAENEKTATLENNLVKITFTNRGGQPSSVELKQFKKWNGEPVVLAGSDFNSFSYTYNAGINQTAQSANTLFNISEVVKNTDQSQQITFTVGDTLGQAISHVYTLKPDNYMLDFDIALNGKALLSRSDLSIEWKTEAPKVEEDAKYEETQTHVCYFTGGDYDFEYAGSSDKSLKFDQPTNWVVLKQQFFASGLIARDKFKSVTTTWTNAADDTSKHYIVRATTQAISPVSQTGNVSLQLYFGPSDFKILKAYNNELENIVPYGSGVFAFVKYINRHFLLPVFDFIQKYVASMGIVILLLTLFIRLITSPILYKSYLSSAKMKALKPEVDALRAKFTDAKTKQLDQQAFGMEQMKLWRSAGVSPLGGCIPALLQLPIFMSLFYFFQSNVDLRGKNFLWAKDLAAYDSIATLPFNIPFYGDHVSLFTLTAVITSLIISVYSMANMQDNSNPFMKYMPYIFPILLLGIFNNMPAALTWYYTVSNAITLIMQFVIQKYIINHEKILAQINENMKKPVKKSKFQERLEQMQEQQKKMQELKNKSNKR